MDAAMPLAESAFFRDYTSTLWSADHKTPLRSSSSSTPKSHDAYLLPSPGIDFGELILLKVAIRVHIHDFFVSGGS